MCALRDSRSISAVSLACQYRMNVAPKRPEPRRLSRKQKDGGSEKAEDVHRQTEVKERVQIKRQESEEEEFDFDGKKLPYSTLYLYSNSLLSFRMTLFI